MIIVNPNLRICKYHGKKIYGVFIPTARREILDVNEVIYKLLQEINNGEANTYEKLSRLISKSIIKASREQAPEVIKALGVRCVIAGSFARIFFRNAINNGLLLIECPGLRADVADGDEIAVEVGKAITCKGKTYPIAALSDNLLEIINAGGLVKAMRRRNGLD